MLVLGANRQHNCRGSEELAILETAGSGLAARSFWDELGVARSSWAPPTRSSGVQKIGSTKLPAISRELDTPYSKL